MNKVVLNKTINKNKYYLKNTTKVINKLVQKQFLHKIIREPSFFLYEMNSLIFLNTRKSICLEFSYNFEILVI